jgi:hypothetical protein
MSRLKSGIVNVNVGDKTYKLVYSIDAALSASDNWGGLRVLMERIAALDLKSMLKVIAIGADLDNDGVRKFMKEMQQNGVYVSDLVAPAQEFALLLFNGPKSSSSGAVVVDEGKD